MQSANTAFGRRLFVKKTPATSGVFCAFVGAVLLALAALIYVDPAYVRPHIRSLSDARLLVAYSAGGLGLLCVFVGAMHVRRVACTRQFFEGGAWIDRGGRRVSLAFADAETVTFAVHTVRGQPERLLVITGSGGRPEVRLTSSDDGEDANDIESASVAELENVSTFAIRAVGMRMVERVDRGEVVKWTDKLWLDPAGLRLEEPTKGPFVPWPAIDGVKDGKQSGRIEVYAFGGPEPVATALTTGVNALPAFQAFMVLLDRGQAAAKAA